MPTILAVNGDLAEIAGRLLAVAGDQPDRVQIVTGGRYPGVSVDDELARAAGFVIDEHESVEDRPAADTGSDAADVAPAEAEAVAEPVESQPAPGPAPEPAPEPEPKKAPAKRAPRSTAK